MADENAPATGAPAAVAQPAPKAQQNAKPVVEALREALKPTKREREAELKAKAEAKGANGLLKDLGVKGKSERARMLDQIKDGKVRLADANEQASAATAASAAEKARADKAEAELKAMKEQIGAYESLAKTYADEQFAALPEGLQKFIAATAGDSLEARLKAIKTAKDSGLITVKEAAAASAQAKTDARPANPANTSNATNPKAPPATANPTPKQTWEQMRAERPNESQAEKIGRQRLAAQFYAANQYAIDSDWS